MPGEVPHTFEQLLIEWLEFARVKFRLVLLQHEHTQTKKLLGNTAPRSSHQRRSQTDLLPSQEPCTMCNGYGHPSGLCPTTLALQQDSNFTEDTIQEFRNQTIECCDICGGEHYEHHHDLRPSVPSTDATHDSDDKQTQGHGSADIPNVDGVDATERRQSAEKPTDAAEHPHQHLLRQPKPVSPG